MFLIKVCEVKSMTTKIIIWKLHPLFSYSILVTRLCTFQHLERSTKYEIFSSKLPLLLMFCYKSSTIVTVTCYGGCTRLKRLTLCTWPGSVPVCPGLLMRQSPLPFCSSCDRLHLALPTINVGKLSCLLIILRF